MSDYEQQEQIIRVYKNAQNRILLYAQAALPEHQFQAFRKLVLDELGTSGAEGRLKQIFSRQGTGGHERETRKEVGEP